MSEHKPQPTVPATELKTHIARAVLVAPDINPKNGQHYAHEVAFTLRPGWSGVGKYETALPGGKIEIAEGDFKDILTPEELADPFLVLTLDQMIHAGLNAAEREVLEELGLPLAAGVLHFIDVTTNKDGWTSYAYVGQLAEKPELTVKPNSAGTRWINVERLLNGKPRLLSGHLGMSRRALKHIAIPQNQT